MRPRFRVPNNKRYFHTKTITDKRDMAILKRKIEVLNRKKDKKEFEKHFY